MPRSEAFYIAKTIAEYKLNSAERKLRYRKCPECRGTGLAITMAGEPWHCGKCTGNGVVAQRTKENGNG